MPRSLRDWLEHIQGNHPDAIDLGLERVLEVWKRMGSPRPAERIIMVAGTNGKGSTVAGIEAGLLLQGHSAGCYTSPHIVHYRERIRLNGVDATDSAIIEGFEAVHEAQGETRLTYFEFATLGAFATLSGAGLDFAVLEIGLGGRLDAVNVIDADLAVITTIGMDHQEYLGDDREAIGRETAGIMRKGQTVICSDRNPPASVSKAAKSMNACLLRIGDDYDVMPLQDHSQFAPWQYRLGNEKVEFPVSPNLAHLADNLAGALTAVIKVTAGADRNRGELAQAVASSQSPGRLQKVKEEPAVFLDVGHNPLAAKAVGEFLVRDGRSHCHAVVAMLADKDAEGVAIAMGEQVSQWYCAGLDVSRGQTGEELAARIRTILPGSGIESYPDVHSALDAALRTAGEEDTVIVFGSFYTVEQAMDYFGIG
jgi:dihydrofolate synthase/folylpolyglutamate synthase